MVAPITSGNKNVDDTSNRSDWVSNYEAGNKNVDDTSTRNDWVSSYSNDGLADHAGLYHWIPLGPEYLKLDYSPIHHEHLITLTSGTKMMDANGLGGFINTVARYLHL